MEIRLMVLILFVFMTSSYGCILKKFHIRITLPWYIAIFGYSEINISCENNINWFEDQSNQSDKYERNRIRKKLLTFDKAAKTNLLSDYNSSIKNDFLF